MIDTNASSTEHQASAMNGGLDSYQKARIRVLNRRSEYSSVIPLRSGPDFICIGAQKAGTSWLYTNLGYHPLVWLPPIKEISYFSSIYLAGWRDGDADHRARQIKEALEWWSSKGETGGASELSTMRWIERGTIDDEWYSGIFREALADQVAGELSPSYSLLPRAGIRHAFSFNPNLKIIALLRDPVSRVLSQIAMTLKDHLTTDRIWALIKSDEMNILESYTDYCRWITAWKSLSGEENFLIDYLGRIEKQPHDVLHKICRFIGIPFDENLFPAAGLSVFSGEKFIDEMEEIRHYLEFRLERIYLELKSEMPDILECLRLFG